MRWSGGARPIAEALVRHPELWPVAVATVLRLAPPGWWRRWPPRPFPDPSYWRFRMVTAYGGSGDREPRADDVVAYLQWCRGRWRRVGGGRG